jgi:hypothetical protein
LEYLLGEGVQNIAGHAKLLQISKCESSYKFAGLVHRANRQVARYVICLFELAGDVVVLAGISGILGLRRAPMSFAQFRLQIADLCPEFIDFFFGGAVGRLRFGWFRRFSH